MGNNVSDHIDIKNRQIITKKSINFDDIINSSMNLAQILQQENLLLEKLKISQIDIFQDKKLQLIDFLEVCKNILAKKPELVEGFTSEKLTRLKEIQVILQQLTSENFTRINQARAVNSKIIEIVKSFLLKNSAVQVGYNKSGTYGAKFKASNDMPPLTIKNNI